MRTYTYSNDYETYCIKKIVTTTETYFVITQDGDWAEGKFKTLKAAKTAIDNQDVWF